MALRTAPRTLALVVGAAYLLLGVLGFLIPNPLHSGHNPDNSVWIFSVGLIQNILHILLGLTGLLAAFRPAGTRFYGYFLFVASIGLTVFGLFAAGSAGGGADSGDGGDLLNINWADNGLHAATAVVGLLIAFLPVNRRERV